MSRVSASQSDSVRPHLSAVAKLGASPAVASILVGALASVVMSGPWRTSVGFIVAVGAYLVLRRLPSARTIRLHESARADAAMLCSVAAATISAGGDESTVVRLCSRLAQPPLSQVFEQSAARINAGARPDDEWESIANLVPELVLLASLMAHSARRGVAAVPALTAAKARLDADSFRTRNARVKRAGVTALLPLGLLGLPGFILFTVVPLVASFVQGFVIFSS